MANANDYSCAGAMNDRLEFDSIEVSFSGRRLLSSIHMASETGSVTGLLGRNGCGKTTLMKIVFGSVPIAQKSVRVNGNSLGLNYLSKKVIAYLPQSHLIPAYLSIKDAFSLFDIDPEELKEYFPEVNEMIRLRPGQLTGGYLRICETFLILRSKAKFCLLDEPFTGLTPLYIDRMKELLFASKSTKGIIISDHMYRHVADISDKLYLLVNGQTYFLKDPQQLVTLGYVSAL